MSYYNELIGGPKGSVERGFTISYWFEALNRDALNKLSGFLGEEDRKLYVYPHPDMLNFNWRFGLLDHQIETVSTLEAADYILVLNRMISSDLYRFLCGHLEYPIATLKDGTFVLALVRSIPGG